MNCIKYIVATLIFATALVLGVCLYKETIMPAPVAVHVYIVQPGDTIWGIASRECGNCDIRVAVDTIIADNSVGQYIYPGQLLYIPYYGG